MCTEREREREMDIYTYTCVALYINGYVLAIWVHIPNELHVISILVSSAHRLRHKRPKERNTNSNTDEVSQPAAMTARCGWVQEGNNTKVIRKWQKHRKHVLTSTNRKPQSTKKCKPNKIHADLAQNNPEVLIEGTELTFTLLCTYGMHAATCIPEYTYTSVH